MKKGFYYSLSCRRGEEKEGRLMLTISDRVSPGQQHEWLVVACVFIQSLFCNKFSSTHSPKQTGTSKDSYNDCALLQFNWYWYFHRVIFAQFIAEIRHSSQLHPEKSIGLWANTFVLLCSLCTHLSGSLIGYAGILTLTESADPLSTSWMTWFIHYHYLIVGFPLLNPTARTWLVSNAEGCEMSCCCPDVQLLQFIQLEWIN